MTVIQISKWDCHFKVSGLHSSSAVDNKHFLAELNSRTEPYEVILSEDLFKTNFQFKCAVTGNLNVNTKKHGI
jgi:hypothetical protein